MTLLETLQYARQLIVELWAGLRKDHAHFLELEQEVRCNEVLETETQALELLRAGEELPQEWNDLVRLRALDAFLSEESGPRASGVGEQVSAPVQLKDGQRYHLYLRPQGTREARVKGKAGHLCNWTPFHRVIPEKLDGGYRVELFKPSDKLFQALAALHARGARLRVAICHFEDKVELTRVKPRPPDWRADNLTSPAVRWVTVKRFLEQAKAEGVHVLVFPELTVTPQLRENIQDWMEEQLGTYDLLLILPGSFHEAIAGQPGKVFNRAELLDVFGRPVLMHLKLVPFGSQGEEGAEDIGAGRDIQLLDLPIGLLAMPICLDFCEADSPIPELWRDAGPEWVLVPAMGDGPSRRAHARAAVRLYTTRGSVTVLANQPKTAGAIAPGFVYGGQEQDPTVWKGEPAAEFQVSMVDIRLDMPPEQDG